MGVGPGHQCKWWLVNVLGYIGRIEVRSALAFGHLKSHSVDFTVQPQESLQMQFQADIITTGKKVQENSLPLACYCSTRPSVSC